MKVNLGELDQILDQALTAPLSSPDHGKVKTALHALAEYLEHRRNTEKTAAVIPPPEDEPNTVPNTEPATPPKPGHGRNGAAAFESAKKIAVPHETLVRGEKCPECNVGKVYPLKEPTPLVR